MLDDLTAFGPFFAVGAHPGEAEPASPWRPASELTRPSGVLRDRVASVRAALAARGGRAAGDVEPRVAASAVHLGLVARLVSPALGAAVLGHRVDMRPGNLWWQDVTSGPVPLSVPVPWADGEHGPPLFGRGHGQLPGEWDRLLFDELLAPVTAAVARLVPVSGRVLWGNVASAVNAAAAQVARQRPDLAGDAWRAAGRLLRSPWLRGEPHPPGPAFRRSSCCLFYRLAPGNPSAVCGDCVLAGRAGSSARLSRTTAAYCARPPDIAPDRRNIRQGGIGPGAALPGQTGHWERVSHWHCCTGGPNARRWRRISGGVQSAAVVRANPNLGPGPGRSPRTRPRPRP